MNTPIARQLTEQEIWDRKSKELMVKFGNPDARFQNSAMFKQVFTSLVRGADPIQIIDQLIDVIDNQTAEMIKLVEKQPISVMNIGSIG